MTPKEKVQRPVFFSLMQIQMPVGAITSILHRVTGVLLALGLPLSLYLLELSLKGPQGYERVAGLFGYWGDVGGWVPGVLAVVIALLSLGALL